MTVSPLTLKLLQIGFLALLWLMVLSVAAVMRGDLFARRRTKAPKPPRPARPARPGKPASLAGAASGAAAESAAGAAQVADPARPRPAPGPPKPRRGAPRTLRITAGALEGTTFELGATPISIGRLPENTVVLDDDYVSGRHARLYPHEGAWVVEDLGSTNGTYLDKTRVSAPTVVPVGAPVRIGKTALELRK